MNFKVIAVYVMWVMFCFLMHSAFGGFGASSGFIEGVVGVGLASLFWTEDGVDWRRK